MRLWDYRLLPYLPKGQLLSQKRECDLIWNDIAKGKQTNHILINYIWEYDAPKEELSVYYKRLCYEFARRGFKFNWNKNALPNLNDCMCVIPFDKHHNKRYLVQCFYNLQEKYDRGQKDFDLETYRKLVKFVDNEVNFNFDYLLNLKEE